MKLKFIEEVLSSRQFAAFAIRVGVPEREVEDALQEAAVAVSQLSDDLTEGDRGLMVQAAKRQILDHAKKCRKWDRQHALTDAVPETPAPPSEPDGSSATELFAQANQGTLTQLSSGEWVCAVGGVRHRLRARNHEEAAAEALRLLSLSPSRRPRRRRKVA